MSGIFGIPGKCRQLICLFLKIVSQSMRVVVEIMLISISSNDEDANLCLNMVLILIFIVSKYYRQSSDNNYCHYDPFSKLLTFLFVEPYI
jgi:hypothetical protein